MRTLNLFALPGVPEVGAGASIAQLILTAASGASFGFQDGDIVVVAQKIVSKAEGRAIALDTVVASERAHALAAQAEKDPRLMELVLREASEVLRIKRGVVIVRHRLGFVMANAGVDQSNVGGAPDADIALLLPQDPDASAARLRDALCAALRLRVGVIVNDSFGRAWRNGVTGVALGVAGLPALVDLRGRPDRSGRALRVTQIAAADELASAASLLMGQGDDGLPVVVARGFPYPLRESSVQELVRPRDEDMFL